MSEATTTHPAEQPIVVFVPPLSTAAEAQRWTTALLAEAGAAGRAVLAGPAGAELLAEVAALEVPEPASAVILLLVDGAAPIYVWLTLAQPAGDPMRLGEAVLDTQMPGVTHAPAPREPAPRDAVHQGYRLARRGSEDGSDVIVHLGVAATTITSPSVGELDICLLYGTTDLEAVENIDVVVARLARDPDLASFIEAL